MFQNNNFQEANINLNGQQYKLEFNITNPMEGSITVFGNIYINSDDPIEFTFFTINNRIAGYTPMNGTKEFIGNIVSSILGHELPFE